MNILLIGSGAREHALAVKIEASPLCHRLWTAPGNAGIASSNPLVPEDTHAVLAFCQTNAVDFVVIGPEKYLADGLSDALRHAGYPVFGPSQAAARLETSKAFMKTICQQAGVATAAHETFTDLGLALTYTETAPLPMVIKADGLAAGKGVIIAQTREEATAALSSMMGDRCFGDAGTRVVIEAFLDGEEVSVFALCDGKTVRYLGHAQDHKRVFDGDVGPNTGGMGAYAPAPILDDAGVEHVMRTIIQPVAQAMADQGCPFQGVLYAGLMMTVRGPFVIEFNARFGDPECQVLMPLIDQDIVPLLYACAVGTLDEHTVRLSPRHALCVVMASQGYPEQPITGTPILSLPHGDGHTTFVLHAATQRNNDGTLMATGGRVLSLVGVGDTLQQARDRAYTLMHDVQWPQGFCRRDIGHRALGRGINTP
ncbi:MAG: phosphoribosylamine--glycine ligase [Alphaproteobacteria bacterium]